MTSLDIQNTLNSYWDGRAKAYHHNQTRSERAAVERPLWEKVWADALPGETETVLDLGCGSGFVTHVLADCGCEVLGIDGSSQMIDEALKENARRAEGGRATAHFRVGDAHQPEVDEGSFDAIASRYVLWTLRDPQAALNNWVSLLKPGGVIACVDAAWYPDGIDPDTRVDSTDGPDAFVDTYTPKLLENLPMSTTDSAENFADLFRAAGLENVTVTPIDGLAELDQRFGLSPGHDSTPQYIIRGTAPA
ncbi:SAM-dependent methyltransferase [Corynebacterium deserti GIMN1.010]|uniref:SAM-dependent methyltransferase n=1 Tax=Corynebacterium deserti GIMN1.010 TaxID=931089 RepID=A0A0M4CNC1_9CORY|nr:class I SAM-dependent methyltransferase [Corynebacterium deserti]ALC06722.1 SAM-dependent methyltransferase [Corynebacterium deserti GIMN1.010]